FSQPSAGASSTSSRTSGVRMAEPAIRSRAARMSCRGIGAPSAMSPPEPSAAGRPAGGSFSRRRRWCKIGGMATAPAAPEETQRMDGQIEPIDDELPPDLSLVDRAFNTDQLELLDQVIA